MKPTAVLPYIKGLSEPLRLCLQQHGVRSVIKPDTTLRSHLVRPKDPVDLRKQDEVVYNAAKYTLAKQEGVCMNGLRSTLGICEIVNIKSADRFKKVLFEYFSQWWILILHNDWCCDYFNYYYHFLIHFIFYIIFFLTSLLLILFILFTNRRLAWW